MAGHSLQPTELNGQIDCPVPEIEYEIALAQMTAVHTLQSQWQSTVDMGELLQVDDLFRMGAPAEVAKIPAF